MRQKARRWRSESYRPKGRFRLFLDSETVDLASLEIYIPIEVKLSTQPIVFCRVGKLLYRDRDVAPLTRVVPSRTGSLLYLTGTTTELARRVAWSQIDRGNGNFSTMKSTHLIYQVVTLIRIRMLTVNLKYAHGV